MKTYLGEISGGPSERYTVKVLNYADGHGMRRLDPRRDLHNHSPDGFSWGYHGSGPAQLALAMLADFTGDDAFALRHYQDWKREFVANLDISTHWRLMVDGSDALSLFVTRVTKATGVEVRP